MNSNQVTPTNDQIQYKGSSIARYLLKLLGWKLYFAGLPAVHGVIIVYPHTSNWDFCLGILAKWGMGIQVHFLAKDSLFDIPLLGSWLRYLGGRPVIRHSPQGYVDQISKEMLSDPFFWVLMAPEGTRKHVPVWKSGFYRLALKAQVPIGMAFIDYANKEIGMKHYFELTGDEGLDLTTLRKEYEGRLGLYPKKMAPIVFGEK